MRNKSEKEVAELAEEESAMRFRSGVRALKSLLEKDKDLWDGLMAAVTGLMAAQARKDVKSQ